jgi:phosphonate degradation associated HDIG domain protein
MQQQEQMNIHKGKTKEETIADEIIHLFEQYGQEDYDGEPVSHSSHMIQCAMQAMDAHADRELILGAFLHDIGHLLKHNTHTEEMGRYGVVNHEGLGAHYLRRKGFCKRVCAIVEEHVPAKRYLVATEPSYLSKLSDASLQTLHWQGGPMTEEEIKVFEAHAFFSDIIKVRLWDEEAKQQNATLLPLNQFHSLLIDYLNAQNLLNEPAN